MASVTIQLQSVCSGGDHATIRLSKGAQVREVLLSVSDLRMALTQEEVEAFCKAAMKLLSEGKTGPQFKSALLAGVTVTL